MAEVCRGECGRSSIAHTHEGDKIQALPVHSAPDAVARMATTAPFDADGRPDKTYSFSGARDAAETPNAPRMSRAERLRTLREML